MDGLRSICFILCICLTSVTAYAQDCTPHTAPAKFDDPKSDGNDWGIIVDGFVGLKSRTDFQQGVDVSHYDYLDYTLLKRCGTQFAFIKLHDDAKDRFTEHQAKFSAQKVPTVPYYFLEMPQDYVDHPEKHIPTLTDADYAPMERLGRDKADAFIELYRNAKVQTNDFQKMGWKFPLVALDVEEGISKKGKSNIAAAAPPDKIDQWIARASYHYGALYAAEAAAFVREIQEKLPAQTRTSKVDVVFYFFPAFIPEFLRHGRDQDFRTLALLSYWIASGPPDGAEPQWDSKKVIADVCLSGSKANPNRCVIHQYTSRARFAIIKTKDGSEDLDLDRMFPVKTYKTGTGEVYARSN